MAVKYRAQILLEPEQHRKLQQIARREGRSISAVAREVIQVGLEVVEREADAIWRKRMDAVDQLSIIREEAQRKYGTYTGDFIDEVRSEREKQLDAVKDSGRKP